MAAASSLPGASANVGPGVDAITFVLLAIAILLVCLRCFVRLQYTKNAGWDDGFIVLTLGILIAGDAIIHQMVVAGIGRHLEELPNPIAAALQILKWNTIWQVLNITGAFFTKLSIGLFLLRFKNTKKLRLTIWLSLLPLGITTFVLDLIVLLQCIPLEALWTPTIEGRCISQEVPLTASYVQSAFAILADLLLTLSPIVILWNIKISLRKKLGICGLMSLGLMATVANALRNAFIPNLTQSDLSYTIVPVIVVSDLEFSLGVIAACIPTLLPLFKRKNGQSAYSKMNSRSKSGAIPLTGSIKTFPRHATQVSTDATLDRSERGLDSPDSDQRIRLQRSYTVEHGPAFYP